MNSGDCRYRPRSGVFRAFLQLNQGYFWGLRKIRDTPNIDPEIAVFPYTKEPREALNPN